MASTLDPAQRLRRSLELYDGNDARLGAETANTGPPRGLREPGSLGVAVPAAAHSLPSRNGIRVDTVVSFGLPMKTQPPD